MTGTLSQETKIMVSETDFGRLEEKVDGLAESHKELANAIGRLILIDERQSNQGQRIGNIEQNVAGNYNALKTLIDQNFQTLAKELARIEKKVDSWINRGVGAWAVVSTLLFIWQMFGKLLIGH